MKIIYVNCGWYATFAVAKRKPEKKKNFRLVWDSNPSLLRCRYSALPVKLTSQLAVSRSLNWFVINPWKDDDDVINTAISRKVVGKNMNATIPKGNMGYDQHAFPDTVAVESSLLLSFSIRKHTSMASRAFLSNFFEEQWTQNRPKYLSALYENHICELRVKN